MKRVSRYSSLAMIVLAGCAAVPEPARIGDLDIGRLPPAEQPAIDFSISRQQVIDSYRQLVRMSPDQPPFDKARQRLADLELETSLDKRLASEQSLARQGQQDARAAVQRYLDYLDKYPQRSDNDRILYQLARAHAIDDQHQQARLYMDRLVRDYPESTYIAEMQFRRGEILFVEGDYVAAEQAYAAVTAIDESTTFHDKALYKLGWARFKQLDFEAALTSFTQLLDIQHRQHRIGPEGLASDLPRAEEEFINDVLRAVSLAFAYSSDPRPIARHFERVGSRVYEPLLYRRLAQHYLAKDRIIDAAASHLRFASSYPASPYASIFHNEAIGIYQQAGYDDLVLQEKTAFIERYNVGSDYWRRLGAVDQARLQPVLTDHLADLAMHFHALARKTGQAATYDEAAAWYRRYLASFGRDTRAARMNFLLAETLREAGRARASIDEYRKTAYDYPQHEDSAEAAYALLIVYDSLLQKTTDQTEAVELFEARANSAIRFSERFANDARAPAVVLNTSEQFFQQQDYARAGKLAASLADDPQAAAPQRLQALTIVAHCHYELEQYAAAEDAYQRLLRQLPESESAQRGELIEQLASSIYMQAVALRENAQSRAAAARFESINEIAPTSEVNQAAMYDAATEYIKLEDWPRAIALLEQFRRRYPRAERFHKGVSEKLALAHLQTGANERAGAEILTLMDLSPAADQADLLWQAANLFEQASDSTRAIALYKRYASSHPRPVDRAIESQLKIARHYQGNQDSRRHRHWLKEIVKSDANAGSQRSPHTRLLAARASLELIRPTHRKFSALQLTIPLKASLKRKKQLMQESIEAYTRIAGYQIEEMTTRATYHIGEIYREFARSLLKSEKPAGLNAEELEEYTFLLEDQAFPFEEKAITIHESNLSRLQAGSYDESIRDSLTSLSEMMPFRYAKNEVTDIHVE